MSDGMASTSSTMAAERPPRAAAGIHGTRIRRGTRQSFSHRLFFSYSPCSPWCQPWSPNTTVMVLSRAGDRSSASSTSPKLWSM